jgi:hypothetical protein
LRSKSPGISLPISILPFCTDPDGRTQEALIPDDLCSGRTDPSSCRNKGHRKLCGGRGSWNGRREAVVFSRTKATVFRSGPLA